MNTIDRKRPLNSYKTAHTRLTNILTLFPKEMWQYRPDPSEWRVHEILVHLNDSEANLYIRARRFIAEPGSKVLEHSEYGIMTLDQWLERADKHASDHIKQISSNYKLWLKRKQ